MFILPTYPAIQVICWRQLYRFILLNVISESRIYNSGTNFQRRMLLKVPLRRKFVALFRPNSVAEYRVVSIFTQKIEQETVPPNIF